MFYTQRVPWLDHLSTTDRNLKCSQLILQEIQQAQFTFIVEGTGEKVFGRVDKGWGNLFFDNFSH